MRVITISRTAKGNILKLSGNVEKDVELNEKTICGSKV